MSQLSKFLKRADLLLWRDVLLLDPHGTNFDLERSEKDIMFMVCLRVVDDATWHAIGREHRSLLLYSPLSNC